MTPARLGVRTGWFLAWSYVAFMVRTFTFHFGLALIVCCAAALLVKRRRLAIIAGVVGAGVAVSSAVRLPEPAHESSSNGDCLTILTANMLYFNTATQPLLDQIVSERPDVILLQEYTPHLHAVVAPALAAEYPYFSHAFKGGAYGQAVFSRRAFLGEASIHTEGVDDSGVAVATGNGPQIEVQVPLEGRAVTVQCVHTNAPGGLGSFASQRGEFAWLNTRVRGRTTPLILAGDFNATNASQHVGSLRAAGMRDALDINPIGRRCTWPDRTILQYVPGIRIDHVMYSEELACDAARVGTSTGSDHLPVIARVRWKEHALVQSGR